MDWPAPPYVAPVLSAASVVPAASASAGLAYGSRMRVVVSYAVLEAVTAAVLLLLCAVLWLSLAEVPESARLFPQAILLVFAVLCTVFLARSLRRLRHGRTDPSGDAPVPWRFFRHPTRFGLVVALLVGYVAAVQVAGYFSGTATMFVALTVLMGYRAMMPILVSLAAFLAFIWVVFILAFERPLPQEFFLRGSLHVPVSVETVHG